MKFLGLCLMYVLNISTRFALIVLTLDIFYELVYTVTSNFALIIVISVLAIGVSVFVRYILSYCVFDSSTSSDMIKKMNDIYNFTYEAEYLPYHFVVYKHMMLFYKSFYYPTLISTGNMKGMLKYFGLILMTIDTFFAGFLLFTLYYFYFVTWIDFTMYGYCLCGTYMICMLNHLMQLLV